ncbi:MAG: tRNA pseudouridine(55) synthase TruB [Chitinophagales bacterium]
MEKKQTFHFQKGEVLLVNKPLDWTSFDVVNKLRYTIIKTLGIRKRKIKIGHAGTLDPKATGLLIICVGKQTKSIETYQGHEKEYTGVIRLGASRPSFDIETEIDQTFDLSPLTEANILETRKQFVGTFEQAAPIFSALKVNGKRMYKHARKGRDIAPKIRTVEVSAFDIPKIELPDVHFRIACGKGTYIRSIAHDFGKALNNGGYLNGLCRIRIGDYHLHDAWDLDELVKVIQNMPVPLSPQP